MTLITPDKFGKLAETKRIHVLFIGAFLLLGQYAQASASQENYLLAPTLKTGRLSTLDIQLEVGGDLIVPDDSKADSNFNSSIQTNIPQKKLPLHLIGNLRYEEYLLNWSSESLSRSLRYYNIGKMTIEVGEASLERTLPESQRLILAEIRDSQVALNGLHDPLTRNLADLLHVVGDSLVLDRLLPRQRLAEGENWKHGKKTIGPLLGMDHVALCEVESVVTEEENGHIRMRLAGTVHGTIDGSATELELRGNYLFDQAEQRISRFNLAIQEHRKMGPASPGLDVVVNLKLKVLPKETNSHFNEAVLEEAKNLTGPINTDRIYSSPPHGVRFLHNNHWFITAETRGQLALRHMKGSALVAHCNISTLPTRTAGRQTTLEQFERDIRKSLGDRLDEVSAAKEWQTTQGHHCLGIFVNGKAEDIPLQWRYYLIATDGMPRISMAITLEQTQIETFSDADRQLIETLQLLEHPTKTALSKTENSPLSNQLQ